MTTKINMSGSHVGAKALCAVTDSTTMEVLPLGASDNGNGVAVLSTKGPVTIVHDGITATATSAEIDCSGYNSLLIHWISNLSDKSWTIQIVGAMESAGTFVEWITSAGVAIVYTTSISGFFIVQGIPDFIKVTATEIQDGATVSCAVQPFNL